MLSILTLKLVLIIMLSWLALLQSWWLLYLAFRLRYDRQDAITRGMLRDYLYRAALNVYFAYLIITHHPVIMVDGLYVPLGIFFLTVVNSAWLWQLLILEKNK